METDTVPGGGGSDREIESLGEGLEPDGTTLADDGGALGVGQR